MARQRSRLKIAARRAVLAGCASLVPAGEALALCRPETPCVTTPLNLGTLGGSNSAATGVSADGAVVVGYATLTGETAQHAFRWAGGTMQDLGTLGGTSSLAAGVSADGAVVVGTANLSGDTAARAFRWEGGTMQNLGTLGGNSSIGQGVSADGTVVVGYAYLPGNTIYRAFRWEGGTMADLGAFGGNYSAAVGASADGAVVVGLAYLPGDADFHAFRWEGGTMADLGTLAGGTSSVAYGVNSDGSVVVGYSGSSAGNRAFRWTAGSNMVDLGVLPGGTYSQANSVSGDGAVVVGISDSTAGDRAFRWTAASAMKDLNTLLADAGVDMTGITLFDARGVSANGQFIVGWGNFPGEPNRAYIVRYYDQEVAPHGPPGPPIAGVTTFESVQHSINVLAENRFGVMAQQHGLAAPLLGGNQAIAQTNQAGVYAAAGSAQTGGHVRFGITPSLALLAGLAYGRADFEDAEIDDSLIVAGALRYVSPTGIGQQGWRPFIEGGGWVAPDAGLEFERHYMNGAGTARGVGQSDGDLSYYYGRIGALLDLGPRHQLALSAELGHERMEVDGYAEPLSRRNPFEATVAPGTDSMDLAKARAQWSFGLSQRFDATLWGAAVYGFDQESGLVAFVPGAGVRAPVVDDDSWWAEYGARIGYAVTQTVTLDLFFDAVSGFDEVTDTRAHGGVGLRVLF